jgi:hypothetical protein
LALRLNHAGTTIEEHCPMRFSLLFFPFIALILAGCVDVQSHPPPRNTTVVTPAPAPPPAVYTPDTSGTVVTQP